MEKYELTLVLTQEAGETTAKATKLATKLLSTVGAKLNDTKVIGLRDLAYPIKKQTKGWYGVFMIDMDTTKVEELDKNIRFNEAVLRHLLVRAMPQKKATAKKVKTSKAKVTKEE